MDKKWIFFLSVKKITTKIVFDGRFAPEHSDLIVMKPNFVIAAAFALSILLLSACKSTTVEVPASMALRNGAVNDPSAVTVKVSLGNRAVYVIENGETKFAAAIAIGTASNPTPVGNFKVQSKEALERIRVFRERRSGYPRKTQQHAFGLSLCGIPLALLGLFLSRLRIPRRSGLARAPHPWLSSPSQDHRRRFL